MSKRNIICLFTLLNLTAFFLVACRRSPDVDVSSSPYYNFSSFSNTTWKTKVRVPLADTEYYTGQHISILVGPQTFDSAHPENNRLLNMRLIEWMPAGTRLRIERLVEDKGSWGGVTIRAILDDGREVYVSSMLLTANKFISDWRVASTNWGVNPDLLEK